MDIEQIKKLYGLSDAELASFVLECQNNGMTTNEEIISALESKYKSDNGYTDISEEPVNEQVEEQVSEPVETKEDKPGLLKRIGLWFDEHRNDDENRNKSIRQSIADSWNNYRDTHDPQFRVGLVNAIFGDNSGLNNYYSQKNSNEQSALQRAWQERENEKSRLAQADYNKNINTALNNSNQTEEERAVDAAELISDLTDKVQNGELDRSEALKQVNEAYKLKKITSTEWTNARSELQKETKAEKEASKIAEKAEQTASKIEEHGLSNTLSDQDKRKQLQRDISSLEDQLKTAKFAKDKKELKKQIADKKAELKSIK